MPPLTSEIGAALGREKNGWRRSYIRAKDWGSHLAPTHMLKARDRLDTLVRQGLVERMLEAGWYWFKPVFGTFDDAWETHLERQATLKALEVGASPTGRALDGDTSDDALWED